MLIGLNGAAGCGKDTLAEQLVLHDVYEQYRFADPIKNMLQQLHIRADVWEDHEKKEKPIPWLGKSPRYLAQTLGAEWGRNLVHPDLWVLLAKGRWHVVNAGKTGRMIISDVRFRNEAEWIHKAGGIVLRVERPDNKHEMDNAAHNSEDGIPATMCDAVVANAGTKDELRELMWEVVRHRLGIKGERQ